MNSTHNSGVRMQTRIGLAILVFCLSAWSQTKPATTTPPRRTPAAAAQAASAEPIAIIDTTAGKLTCPLFPKQAPIGVDNFIGLATGTKDWTSPTTHEKKHGVPLYDGTVFHRVIANFMIQGGDPTGTGRGDPGYRFEDEVKNNPHKHQVGSLSMANAGPNTNGSQFFITHIATDWLNGKHTVFGQVRSGQDVVNAIQAGDELIGVTINEK